MSKYKENRSDRTGDIEVNIQQVPFFLSFCGRVAKLVNTMLVAWWVSFQTVKEFEDAVVMTQTVMDDIHNNRGPLSGIIKQQQKTLILLTYLYRVLGLTKPIQSRVRIKTRVTTGEGKQ